MLVHNITHISYINCSRCTYFKESKCTGDGLQCEGGTIGYFAEVDAVPSRDKKYDEGKPNVYQMQKDFAKALLSVAEVTSYGIKKYNQPGSWKLVDSAFHRYSAAGGRHVLQSTYEERCEESELLHLAHAAWNALAALQLYIEEHEV